MSDKKLVIANWKMNPVTAKEAEEIFDFVARKASRLKKVNLIFCPPSIYLPLLSDKIRNMNLGAQNMYWEAKGAYTGEVSPLMFKDFGVSHVIIGHSERRYKMGETDEMVNKKVKAAFKYGLVPVIAVGERERTNFDSSGKYINVVDDIVVNQLKAALKDIPSSKIKSVVIAYEPVWAISTSGTGLVDTPEDALSVSLLIRKVIAKMTSIKVAHAIPVLYGGSVDSKNVGGFVKQEGIDGVLVGGASINKGEFVKLLEVVGS